MKTETNAEEPALSLESCAKLLAFARFVVMLVSEELDRYENANHDEEEISIPDGRKSYAYGVETPGYRYCFRMIPERGDYHFYVYCYDKSATKVFEQPEKMSADPVKTKPVRKEEMAL